MIFKKIFFGILPFMLPWQPIKSSNLDKSLMKCGELFNKHFCENKGILLYPRRHSNESSWTLTIKNITFVDGNFISKYAKFQLHPPYHFFEEEF